MVDKPRYDTTQARRQSKRRAALNALAVSLGFTTWGKLETAALRGEIRLTVTPSESGKS